MVRPTITPGLCPIVLQRTARLLALAMVLVAGYVFGWPSHEAQAQQVQQGQINPDSLVIRPRRLNLRDVWGPPKMPPAPKDFGPHFDFPAGGSMNLGCGPPTVHNISAAGRQTLPIRTNLHWVIGGFAAATASPSEPFAQPSISRPRADRRVSSWPRTPATSSALAVWPWPDFGRTS